MARFQKPLRGDAWSLDPVAGDIRNYGGALVIQKRPIRFRLQFPPSCPFEEPTFIFSEMDVNHSCVDPSTGVMSPIWGEYWTPVLCHPNPIMESILSIPREEIDTTCI